jgi:hypothetical protein
MYHNLYTAFSCRELPGLVGGPASRLGNRLDRLHLRKLKARWSASWSSDDILTVSINTRGIGQQLLERIGALDLAPSYRESFDATIAGLAKHDRIDTDRVLAARKAL